MTRRDNNPGPAARRGDGPRSIRRGRASHTTAAWLLGALLLAGGARAGDWPTFRGDPQRSGATAESLALPLERAWTHAPAHPPAPAWPEPAPVNYAVMHGPLRQTLDFDRAFHAVADADAVYYGSSADDTVTCLDAATGTARWRFTAEGPVRLAPALHAGRLFAGSDDGWLYALEPRTGTVAWKHRAGPDDRRLPGNGRMISLWPVRGGLLADGGTVYFTAGLFPCRGVFLCALDAATGREVYKTPLAFSAQGTILAAENTLFIATGRTAFWSCDRRDGSPRIPHGASDPWKMNLVGGSTALVTGDLLATGPSEDGQFHWFTFTRKTPLLRAAADGVVADATAIYVLGRGRLTAQDRAPYLIEQKEKERKDPPPRWSVDAGKSTTLVLAGNGIVTGGDGFLAIHAASDGKVLWSDRIDGRVEGLAVSHGRLLVSLDDGRTACYRPRAPRAPAPPADAPPAGAEPGPADPLIARAAEAALVLQPGTGRLAREIARRSGLRVLCREPDPARAEALRSSFAKAGLLGTRIDVHAGDDAVLPYPPGFANLVLSEDALADGSTLPPVAAVRRALRPYGGVVVLAVRPGSEARRRLETWGRSLPDWRVQGDNLLVGTARGGIPAGAGEWTHFYADPANTACSDDAIRPGPMDLQWFGRPGPAGMVDRHKKGPAPLFANGRLFVPGFNRVTAVDAFNGTILWEREIPDSVRVAAFKDAAGVAATASELLMVSGDACLVLDAQTGATRRRIPAPGPAGPKAWGYLATVGGRIVGSVARPGGSLRAQTKAEDEIIWRNLQPLVCSTSVFAVDAASGRTLWEYAARGGAIPNPSLTILGGRVCFLESRNARTLEAADGRVRIPDLVGSGARLVALDLETGVPAWSTEADLRAMEHVLFMSGARETLLVTGTRYAEVDPSETKGRAKPTQLKRVRYDLVAFDARTGAPRWKTTAIPSYDEVLTGAHGEQVQHPAIVGEVVYGPGFAVHLLTGRPHDGWAWQKSAKCATLSTSRHAAFSRFATAKLPHVFDLATGEKTVLSRVTRPGCWINMIPAGGLLLIPEASSGCTCEYPFQASMALRPGERAP
jgi:outer membrane protein assembly factor BamB